MLRWVSKLCTVLAWIVAVTGGLVVQVLTLLAFSGEYWSQEGRPLLFVCVLISTLCLWTGLILYVAWKKRPYVGLTVVTVSAVLFFITALLIRHYTMPGGLVTLRPSDGKPAIDSLKLLLRHDSPLLVPLFLWLATWSRHAYDDRRLSKQILQEIRSSKTDELQTLSVDTTDKRRK